VSINPQTETASKAEYEESKMRQQN